MGPSEPVTSRQPPVTENAMIHTIELFLICDTGSRLPLLQFASLRRTFPTRPFGE